MLWATIRPDGTVGDLKIKRSFEPTRRSFFVTRLDEPYLVLMSAEGLDDSIDAIARDAEDGINAPIDESFNEYVGSVQVCGPS